MTTLLDAPGVATAMDDADSRPEGSRISGNASRVGWSLVSLLVAFSGQQIWTGSLDIPGANIASMLLILGGLISLWWIWFRQREVSTWVQVSLLTGLVVGISFQGALMWRFDPAYGTDGVAFDQYAAWLTLHGINPYTHSMEPSLSMFHVPAIFHTYRLDGTAVTDLSYPSGSFLPYIPLLAFGVTTQAANIVDLVFWFAGMFILWRVLPRDVRWVAGVIGSGVVYVGFVIGGLTDALFVPFVLLAVYKWDRFADPAHQKWTRWIGPLAFGFAVSIKQTPWFLAPYLLLGLCFEARGHGVKPTKVVGKYLAVVTGVFAVLNGPFIIADPGSWSKGVLLPLLDPTILDGQGLVNLVIYHHLGGGKLQWFTVLGMGFVLLTLIAFTLRYTSLKRAWVPLIAISFFLPTRSFASYLFMLIPASLVAAMTVRPATGNPFPTLTRHTKPVLALGALGVLSAGAMALTAPAPLEIKIISTRSTGQLQTLEQVTVDIRNLTAQTVRPHFTINASNHATTFWYAPNKTGASPIVLAPHARVTVTLQAPNTASMPAVSAPLVVEAFTSTPASVSVSDRYLVSAVGTRIVPDAINTPVPVGRPVKMLVQAENEYGAPILQAGIPITLGQTVYGQDALFAGEASINGFPEGFSPVTMPTNAAGQVEFTIVGIQSQPQAVYFQALIQRPGEVPHGYSNQLTVQFVAKKR